MANPLQPKVLKVLREEFGAYAINVTSASLSGVMDVVCCINGAFYGFEVKWRSDQPSELQKQNINQCLDAGGRAWFVRDIPSLRQMLLSRVEPIRYDVDKRFRL